MFKKKYIYSVKKTKIIIQNKYVFRTIISEFLYLKKKHINLAIISNSRCIDHFRPRYYKSDMTTRSKHLGSDKKLSINLKINPFN